MWFQNKRYLSLGEVDYWCQLLTQKVASSQPDVVISIESGGWYLGKSLSKELKVPHFQIGIGRNINYARLYGRFPDFLRFLPAIWHGLLFLSLKPVLTSSLSKAERSFLVGKRVLIVDDVVQSGRTMRVAKEHLITFSPATLHTAALCNVIGGSDVHYSCFRGLSYYPWSRSSAEHATYLTLRGNST